MGTPKVLDVSRAYRPGFIIQDPVRFGCLVSAATLALAPSIPFVLTLFVVLVAQLAPVAMVARARDAGWSRRFGRGLRESVFASNLAMDFTNLGASTVVGALLLVRNFNGTDLVRPLAILAAGICLLPDIRLCRWLLADDPHEQSRRLREGCFFSDPVMQGALLAAAAVLVLDRISLHFVMLSLGFLQVNTILTLLDKYLPEIEVRRFCGGKALLMEREGRRLAVCLAPLGLVPLRLALGEDPAWFGAGAIAAAIVVPDACRALGAGLRAMADVFRVSPAPARPATMVVLPK